MLSQNPFPRLLPSMYLLIQIYCSFFAGSPAYDSVRPLSYQDANVFLLCYKISDPISLYNVKNKWIRELKTQRADDTPVILCGCQSDLRTDPATLFHLSKTGRTPVSTEQALAICCEVGAVNYVETSAKYPDRNNNNLEAFEVCALAAIKHQAQQKRAIATNGTFKKSPSINSTMSLFVDPAAVSGSGYDGQPYGYFRRSPSNNSNLSLSANVRLNVSSPNANNTIRRLAGPSPVPSLQSPSYSDCDSRQMTTFSPEPTLSSFAPQYGEHHRSGRPSSIVSDMARIPPAIIEDDTYQNTQYYQQNDNTLVYKRAQRPSSLCDARQVYNDCTARPMRPTTLFKGQQRSPAVNNNSYGLDSASEVGTPTSSCTISSLKSPSLMSDTSSPAAQIRPHCLSRRTSYRTYQKVPIPVAAPLSPVASSSECSYDIKSPNLSSPSPSCMSPPLSVCSNSTNVARYPPLPEDHEAPDVHHHKSRFPRILPIFENKTYESLKSHLSTSSQDSTGSKNTMSSGSDLSQANSSSSALPSADNLNDETDIRKCFIGELPDTEDPELIRSLSFVSPKIWSVQANA